jgi:tetratricopeptide (TPR) repeat protein
MTDQRDCLSRALRERYALERELGRGGMATVYLARDLKHQRQVALKVLRPDISALIGAERFVREIAIVAKLAHPHVLPLHDSGVADGHLYYVMPFVEGESLRARLERERQLPVEDAVRIGEEVADALAHAHSRGVVHRDIKPENILLESGHAVVADFGIARVLSETGGTRLTDTGLAIGTAGYMSPEQASGETSLDERADVYSAGCVVYEMLSGEPPHTGPTPQVVLARALTESVRPLTAVREAVSPQLDLAVRKALAKSPADRYASAAEFKAALRAAMTAPVAGGARRIPPRRTVRKSALLTLAVIAAIAVLGLVWQSLPGTSDQGLRLAVFPFMATAAPAREYSERLPDLLATVLDGTPGVRVADPWSLWSGLRPERGARAQSPAGVDDASRRARRAHAGMFLLGSIEMGSAATLAVTTRVYRVGRPDAVHTLTQTAHEDSVGPLAHRLAVDLITRMRPGQTVSVPELEGFTTRSPDAIKAYLRAKEAMRRGQVDSADAEIDAAIRADTAFAVALVEAVRVKSWTQFMRGQFFTGLVDLLDRAERYTDSLSPRNRLRLQASRASVRTEGAKAVAATREILAIDSTDLDAWIGLAYYHRVYGWQYGAGESEATEALEKAIALDSSHVPALTSLINGLQMVDDPRAARYGELLRRADTSSALARGALLGNRVLMMPDSVFMAFVDTLARFDPRLITPALRALRVHRPDRAMELLSRLRTRQEPGTPDYRSEWGRMLAAQGRFRELDSALRAGAFPTQTTPRWFLVAPQSASSGDSLLASQAAAFLHQFIPPDSALVMFQRMPVWVNGWNVGAYHAGHDDTTIARRWQVVFGMLPGGGTPLDYRGSLQADIESRLLERNGDLQGALAAATRAYDLWGIHTENIPEFHPEPGLRFHLAMLHLANRNVDGARELLRSLVPPTTWMGFLTARASLELGRLTEERGDRVVALRHYSTAYRFYRTADPALAGFRDAARDGLARLTAESATAR